MGVWPRGALRDWGRWCRSLRSAAPQATQPSVAEMELNGVDTYTEQQITRYMNLKAKHAIRSSNEVLKK